MSLKAQRITQVIVILAKKSKATLLMRTTGARKSVGMAFGLKLDVMMAIKKMEMDALRIAQ